MLKIYFFRSRRKKMEKFTIDDVWFIMEKFPYPILNKKDT